jgi:hypothetical protein
MTVDAEQEQAGWYIESPWFDSEAAAVDGWNTQMQKWGGT